MSTNVGAGSYIVAVTNGGTALSGVSLTTDNTWTNNNRFSGPVPFVDVTAYGARALPGGAPFTHGDCTNGSNQITNVTGASWGFSYGFNPNDGITLYGCGATNTLTTPAGLIVTPGGIWGMTNTQSPTTGAAATGASTYQYTVIARDKFGALTAPATPVTITNGLAALGKQTRTISTLSRSNDIITVVTTAAHNLLVNDLIEIIPTSSQQFAGWYNVAQIDSSTQFEVFNTPVDTRAQGWMLGDTTSYSGGGVVVFYRNNYLTWTPTAGAWMYYVCAKRPGDPSLALIGMTRPSVSGTYIDASFEDYGSPYQDNQVYPTYVTNSSCTGSATNDPLTSYIVSSPDGGSTLILHDTAGQNKTGTLAVFDAAPGIARAAAVAGFVSPNFLDSSIFIPPAGQQPYLINSYLALPAQLTVWQSGKLTLNETIGIQGSTNWFGDFGSQADPQFGLSSGSLVTSIRATPGVYATGDGNSFRNLIFTSTNANGAVLVVDDSTDSNYDFVDFSTGGASTDYLGMDIVMRGHTSIERHFFDRTAFITGPDQVNDKSWQPNVWIAPAQNFGSVGIEIVMSNTSWNRRGIVEGGGGNTGILGNSGQCPAASFTSYYSYRQGGITPMMASLNCSSHNLFSFTDASQDTEGQPLLANLNANATASGKLGPKLFAHNDTGGAQAPLVQGIKPSSIDINSGILSSAKAIPNRNFLYKSSGSMWLVTSPYDTTGSFNASFGGPLYTIAEPVHGTGGYSWWFDLPAPTNVVGTPAAGGSLAAGTYLYAVGAVGADSGETIMSVPSASVTTSGGNLTVNLTWTNASQTYSNNIYRCNTTNSCLNADGTVNVITAGIWFRIGLHQTGTSFSDTGIVGTAYQVIMASGSGATIMNATGLYAPKFQCREGAVPSGLANADILYCNAADHRLALINNNGTSSDVATLADILTANSFGLLSAATNSNAGTFAMTGSTWDVHNDLHTLPVVSGTAASIPATCTVGEMYFATDATAGQNIYECASTNVWTQQLNSGAAGASTSLGNLAAVAINTTLLPAAVNTVALGSTSLPFTNVCLGTVANQAACYDTSSLSANRTIKLANAAMVIPQGIAAVSHNFLTALSGTTGAFTQAQPTLADIAAGASPAGLFNFSGSTMEIPASAGFTASAVSTIGLDTTANTIHFWINSADALGASFASAPAGSKCAQTTSTKGQLTEAAGVCGTTTPSSTDTFTNKTENVESTGNSFSEPVRAYFPAAGCGGSGSTAGNGWDVGTTNIPVAACSGSTVRKAVLQFARGNVAYLNWHLPPDWNSSASTDIELGFTTTDTTNGHVTSFNIQTACNVVNGTATDDPALNALQALSVTTGASQISGGQLVGTKTGLTMTGCAADRNFEVVVTRNNSGTDTNTDTSVALKFAEITTGVTKNGTNR